MDRLDRVKSEGTGKDARRRNSGTSSASSSSAGTTSYFARIDGLANMIETTANVVINRPTADVFDFVVNVDNIPLWINGARVLKLSQGPVGENFSFQHDNVVLIVRDFRVNRRFETESVRIHFPVRLILAYSHGVFVFEPLDRRTKVTLDHQVRLRAFLKPFERMVAKKAQSDSEAALDNLRSVLEG